MTDYIVTSNGIQVEVRCWNFIGQLDAMHARAIYHVENKRVWFDRTILTRHPRELIGHMYDVAEGKSSLPIFNKQEQMLW